MDISFQMKTFQERLELGEDFNLQMKTVFKETSYCMYFWKN